MKQQTKLFIRFLKERNEYKEFNERIKEYAAYNMTKHEYISSYRSATVWFLETYHLSSVIKWFKLHNCILSEIMQEEWKNYYNGIMNNGKN